MRFLLALCSVFFPLLAQASGVADLKAFIQQSRALSAHFTQHVVDQKGKKTESSTGTLHIQRPGKFYWHYTSPSSIEIIGDGKKVWIYDPELKQVTVKNMHNALESSPAALLAGDDNFEKNYHITALPDISNIVWLQATPKLKDSYFQQIRIGLQNQVIHTIILVDQLGQTTTIIFDKVVLNPRAQSNIFTFVPPKDVDLISE